MPLSAGARLGPYEVIAPLGAGGMGEVFRARDTRLKRDVALKILPDALAADADRVARFQREAEILAALNHPHIATIYSLEVSDAATGIAMELIEGDTLADRIARGRIPLHEAIRVAMQLAAALDAAHERSVVHRDLKPTNIKLTSNGDAKILDFGLAKLAGSSDQAASSDSDRTLAPTMTSPALMTGVGVILGTAAYMAPEQARGLAVDKRADIWSFGCIVYEMLTGTQAFSGNSVADCLSAILHREPDWNALPADVPEHVRSLLQRCLIKDRQQRLRDIGDIRWAPEHRVVSPARTRRTTWTAAGVAAALAVVAAVGWIRTPSGSEQPRLTLTVLPPIDLEINSSAQELSPNGAAVAYLAFNRTVGPESGSGLYVRRLESLEARRVPGSENLGTISSPIWSPNSSAVLFLSPRGFVRVPVPEGPPQLISGPLPSSIVPRGASWSDTGTILLAMPLTALSESDGSFRPVSVPGLRPGQIQSPEFLPGGNDLLFLLIPDDTGEPEVYIGTLRGDEIVDVRLLFRNDTAARYTPAGGGRVVFVRNDNLYSQLLNRSTRSLEGDVEIVVRSVASIPGNTFYRGYFSVSHTGAIAWKPGTAELTQATVFDRRGEQVGTAGPPGLFVSVVLSPDETRLLTFAPGLAAVVDVAQPGRAPIARDARWFAWSSDSARLFGMQPRVMYGQTASGVNESLPAFVDGPADGSSETRTIAQLERPFMNPQDVSPDGTVVLGQQGGRVAVLRTNRDGAPGGASVSFLADDAQRLFAPRFSPDGRWVVFEDGTEGGPGALYVQPFPGPGRRRQIAPAGQTPEWRRDGREIIFRLTDSVWSIPVTVTTSDISFGTPVRLFSGLRRPPGTTVASRGLALSRDGSRIFVAQRVEQREPNVIHVMTSALPR